MYDVEVGQALRYDWQKFFRLSCVCGECGYSQKYDVIVKEDVFECIYIHYGACECARPRRTVEHRSRKEKKKG